MEEEWVRRGQGKWGSLAGGVGACRHLGSVLFLFGEQGRGSVYLKRQNFKAVLENWSVGDLNPRRRDWGWDVRGG